MANLLNVPFAFDPRGVAFTAFTFDPDKINVIATEKEKGGRGSPATGAAMVDLLTTAKIQVHIVDLASKQLDLAVLYSGVDGVIVHEPVAGEASGVAVLRTVSLAETGSVVVVQWPESAIEDLGLR